MKCPVDYLMSIEAYCIICSHRTSKNLRLELQETGISWSNFWNWQIVCLHASVCFGTGCTFLPRLRTGKWGERRRWFGTSPEEFPVYRECPTRRGQKEMPCRKRTGKVWRLQSTFLNSNSGPVNTCSFLWLMSLLMSQILLYFRHRASVKSPSL